MKPHKLFEIYQDRKRIYTKSAFPGTQHFEEKVFKENGHEYREFDPRRSKLAATIVKGCPNITLRKGNVILYLGMSHGYTTSFVSDIVGKKGLIFGVDPAPRVVRDAVFLAEQRTNIVPILADANHPDQLISRIAGVDVVYQDISQRNQAEIFIKNCEMFLKKDGFGLLAVKAKSIDVKKRPREIFVEIRKKLEKLFTVIDYRTLDPLQKDHAFIIVKNDKET